jgi:hypothetical protein
MPRCGYTIRHFWEIRLSGAEASANQQGGQLGVPYMVFSTRSRCRQQPHETIS